MKPRGFVGALIVFLSAGAGCGSTDDRSAPAEPTVRDSAGITIIEYAVSWDDLPRLALDSTSAGQRTFSTAREGTDLFMVRGVVRFPSGIVAVANGGTREILWFDDAGRHVRTTGRAGEGPGEFRGLLGIYRVAPDSLLAHDGSLQRFQLFDSAGSLVRSFRLERPGEGPTFPRILSSNTSKGMVVGDLRPFTDFSRIGVVQLTQDLLLYGRSGTFLDTIAVVPAWEAYNAEPVDGVRLDPVAVPWGPSIEVAVTGDRILLADTRANEIREIGLDGDVRRILRGPSVRPATITEADVERFRRRATANAPPPAVSQILAAYDAMPIPDTKPAIRSILATDDGGLWLIGWPDSDSGAVPVTVLDSALHIMGTLRLPAAFTVHSVSSRRVLGVSTDSLGVEEVREYLVRAEGASR